MSKSVLVTGASGFIAQQLIIDLLERGYSVRGTVRSLKKADQLRSVFAQHSPHAREIELVEADLESDTGWPEAVAGIDCVMHVASPFPLAAPKDPMELIIPAREGTLRVLRAAQDAGVSHVVLTSSTAAVQFGHKVLPEVLTEHDWSNPENARDCSPYAASKTIAERAAWDFVAQEAPEMALSVINPSGVFGPIRSADIRTSLRLIDMLLQGKIPMAPDAGTQAVDVRDVSVAHIAAMEKPEAKGERFIVAADYLTMLETASILAKEFPEYAAKMPTRKIPSFIIKALAPFNSTMKSAASELGKRRFCSGEKARRMLLERPYISGSDAVIASAQTLLKYGVDK